MPNANFLKIFVYIGVYLNSSVMNTEYIKYTCEICFEVFDEDTRCPRVISCGHSFCHSCLEKVLAQSPVCPTCKADIQFCTVESIPVNYYVKNMVTDQKVSIDAKKLDSDSQSGETLVTLKQKRQEPKKLLSEGFCEDHQNFKELRCMDCALWICGVCVALSHKAHRIALVEQALEEMKKSWSVQVENDLQFLNIKNECNTNNLKELTIRWNQLQQDLQKCEESIEKVHEENSQLKTISDKLKHLLASVKNADNHEQLLESIRKAEECMKDTSMMVLARPRTLQDLKHQLQHLTIYVINYEGGTKLHGQLSVQDDRIFISCFQTKAPEGQFSEITLDELMKFDGLKFLDHNLEFPKTDRAFLKFCDEDNGTFFEVVLQIQARGDAGKNFLLLCSGLKQKSYKGLNLEWKRYWLYCSSSGSPAPVLKTLRGRLGGRRYGYNSISMGQPMNILQKGMIYGIDDCESEFHISIYHGSNYRTYANKLGLVETGLDHLEAICAEGRVLKIEDCGLVL